MRCIIFLQFVYGSRNFAVFFCPVLYALPCSTLYIKAQKSSESSKKLVGLQVKNSGKHKQACNQKDEHHANFLRVKYVNFQVSVRYSIYKSLKKLEKNSKKARKSSNKLVGLQVKTLIGHQQALNGRNLTHKPILRVKRANFEVSAWFFKQSAHCAGACRVRGAQFNALPNFIRHFKQVLFYKNVFKMIRNMFRYMRAHAGHAASNLMHCRILFVISNNLV